MSQSDIIRFLVGRLGEFPQIFNKNLNELGLSRKKNLIKVRKTEAAVKALSLIIEHKISGFIELFRTDLMMPGVAVIDDDGKLIGNFSASDLKVALVTFFLTYFRVTASLTMERALSRSRRSKCQ